MFGRANALQLSDEEAEHLRISAGNPQEGTATKDAVYEALALRGLVARSTHGWSPTVSGWLAYYEARRNGRI